MSQERTRFPIQPQDRRRSAKSSKDVKRAPEEARPIAEHGGPQQDKPDRPPHRRHEGPEDKQDAGAEDEDQPDEPVD